MTINEMIQALQEERQEHGGDIECVIEIYTTFGSGVEVVAVDELSTQKRTLKYKTANRRNDFKRDEKCTMFLC